jgi:two-component system sensor histidine kinase/response regulator
MPRILVIEDSVLTRKEILTILRLRGYDAIGAKGGQDGIELAHRVTPDLILCDVKMPELDGYAALTSLRDDPITAGIPFIFLTGHSDPGAIRQAMNMGADDFLVKPFSEPELLAAINARLKKHEAIKQRYQAELDQAEAARHDAETQLEQLRRAISINVNHELRTSVAGIMQTLDLVLKARFGGNAQTRQEYIKAALNNTRRVHGLVEDLIALKDIDQGNINTFRQPIDLQFDFQRPVSECLERWEHRHLNVHIDVAPNVVIYAPKNWFRHAVSHLVDNACKFSPEGGLVAIELTAHGEGGCILTVTDQGIGIPPDQREHVFERYYQISQGDNRAFDGLGVGLTIVRAFARGLGGDVIFKETPSGCQVELTILPAQPDWQTATALLEHPTPLNSP